MCSCPKLGSGFPTSYVVVFCLAHRVEVKGDCSMDIDGIVDHHCNKKVVCTTHTQISSQIGPKSNRPKKKSNRPQVKAASEKVKSAPKIKIKKE